MDMAKTTILSLPMELLDRIYFYLDWDPSECLRPSRQDIMNISRTCRHLRQSTLPWIFRHVRLKLRWVEGALVEPSLFKLRRDHPHLAKSVRSVYMKTCFGQQKDSKLLSNIFGVPEDFSKWLSFAVESEEGALDREASHRKRLSHVARGFIEKYFYSEMPSNCPLGLRRYIKNLVWKFLDQSDYDLLGGSAKKWFMATKEAPFAQKRLAEDSSIDEPVQGPTQNSSPSTEPVPEATVTQLREYRDVQLQLDAFVVALLCLPASVNSIAFESVRGSRKDLLQNDFALHLAAISMNIFGDRLRRVTMITNPIEKDVHANTPDPVLHGESSIVTDTVVRTLTSMDSLVLSGSGPGEMRFGSREFLSDWQIQWHSRDTITRLELWNMECRVRELTQFITGFTRLQDLTLKCVRLDHTDRTHPPARRIQLSVTIWLTVLIDLRRQLPEITLKLSDLDTVVQSSLLAPSAIRWIQKEAIPAGQPIDIDREARLTEDFASFQNLWEAEDSDRGVQAQKARKDGRLVDEAMSNRWRGF